MATADEKERPILVTGAGGFLGSHVVRKLVADGQPVRAFVKRTTNLASIADLPVEWVYGDVLDAGSVGEAVAGCASVIHCVVNTQAWLRDPTPMFLINVEGLRNVMDAALTHRVGRFVMTSTIGTIGRSMSGVSAEDDIFNWEDQAGGYIQSRVAAERLFFNYVRDRGLPGIAMNVANTYGPGDYAPTPHGRLLAAAALGKLRFAVNAGAACVGVEDAADAMILAERKGVIGERYIVTEKWLTQKAMFTIAAQQAGQAAHFRVMPLWVLYMLGFLSDGVSRIRNRDSQLSVESARLTHIINDMDNGKARRELGWAPRPVENSIRAAADFYVSRDGIPRGQP